MWLKYSSDLIKPLHATGLFLYLLKTSEIQKLSDVFREYRIRSVAWDRLLSYHFEKENQNEIGISGIT